MCRSTTLRADPQIQYVVFAFKTVQILHSFTLGLSAPRHPSPERDQSNKYPNIHGQYQRIDKHLDQIRRHHDPITLLYLNRLAIIPKRDHAYLPNSEAPAQKICAQHIHRVSPTLAVPRNRIKSGHKRGRTPKFYHMLGIGPLCKQRRIRGPRSRTVSMPRIGPHHRVVAQTHLDAHKHRANNQIAKHGNHPYPKKELQKLSCNLTPPHLAGYLRVVLDGVVPVLGHTLADLQKTLRRQRCNGCRQSPSQLSDSTNPLNRSIPSLIFSSLHANEIRT